MTLACKRFFLSFFAFSLSLASGLACAETGVTADEILVGESVVLSGPQAENGDNYARGIRLYFDQVNAGGGVNGRKLKLVVLDDAYNPKTAAANTQKLIEENKVFALFGYAGTGPTLASLPIADKARVPLVAPLSGADILREKMPHTFFVLRAGYGDEMMRSVEQLVTTGVNKIAVAYQDDGFGKSALKAAEAALTKFKLQPAAVGAIDGKTYDAAQAVAAVLKAKPDAILMGTAGKASVNFIRDYLKTGERPQFFGLSVMSAKQLRSELGADSTGIIVAQVVPSPWSTKFPVVKQYQTALAKAKEEPHYNGLEGWIAAQAFVEGLKRAGKDLTREKFIAAMEGMRNYDIGGFLVSFSPERHTGSSYVDLSIIRHDGQFLQ